MTEQAGDGMVLEVSEIAGLPDAFSPANRLPQGNPQPLVDDGRDQFEPEKLP